MARHDTKGEKYRGDEVKFGEKFHNPEKSVAHGKGGHRQWVTLTLRCSRVGKCSWTII